MQEIVTRKSECLTHLLRRKVVKVSPNRGEAPQIHLRSTSDKTILYGPTLKIENTVYKMTVCRT